MKIRIQNWVNSLAWDWVVSRQRYFATAIPLWECEDCGDVLLAEEDECYVDPTSKSPRKEKCGICGGKYVGSTDVFDTWMDSSISPLYNTFWERDEKLFKKLYPMSLRPQGLEIIRTWAYYTILREMLLIGEKPWKETMIHGFIMAPDGTPMHASMGNVVDPVPLMEKHGGDAMRYYAATCALGIDHAFKEQELVRGGRLATKVWNVMKMVGTACETRPRKPRKLHPADAWILSRFGALLQTFEAGCEKYRFDQAMAAAEDFMWHEFADHYIELVKHRAYSDKDGGARYVLYTVGLGLLKVFSMVLPFVAEDAYQLWFKRHEKPISIHVSEWPEMPQRDEEAERKGEAVKSVVAAIRAWKSSQGISLNEEVARIELVGASARNTFEGSEDDIQNTLKAKELAVMDSVQLREIVTGVKPLYSKLGPSFKADSKEIAQKLREVTGESLQGAWEGISVLMSDGRSIDVSPDYYELRKKIASEKGELEQVTVQDFSVLIYR
jgi:valyl-tRNA synthetase